MILNFFKSISLSDWGSYASLVGLVFSLITLILVYYIKKRLKAKVRIPELIEELKLVSTSVSTFVGMSNDDKAALYKSLAECKSLVDKLYSYSEKDTKVEIKKLKSKLKTKSFLCFKFFNCYDITEFVDKDIDDVYIRINIILSKVVQQVKDMRIE